MFASIMKQRVYIIRPAVFAPAILSVIAIVSAFQESWWFLVSLPFIWLGSTCAQPNLNLANGCLGYLAMVVGFAVMAIFKPLGSQLWQEPCLDFIFLLLRKAFEHDPLLMTFHEY